MFWAVIALWLGVLALSVSAADTYSLADGTTLTGDIVTFTDAGIILRTADDKYTDRMPWTAFSQAGLQQLAQNPKIKPLVEPFMELPPVAREQPADNLEVHPAARLDLPARQSLLGAMASSSVGIFLLLMVYLANLYASFEIAVCRARPLPVVMGVSAVLPIIGPAIFYSLPTNQPPSDLDKPLGAEAEAAPAAPATPAAASEAAASQSAPAGSAGPAAPTAGYTRPTAPAGATRSSETAEPAEPAYPEIQVSITSASAPREESPVSQVFKRGQFTFNRRFFETKFGGFAAAARSEADKKLDLLVKLPQGEFVVQRIVRIGVSDADFEVIQEGQPQVITAPFADIQEINLKSKTV